MYELNHIIDAGSNLFFKAKIKSLLGKVNLNHQLLIKMTDSHVLSFQNVIRQAKFYLIHIFFKSSKAPLYSLPSTEVRIPLIFTFSVN
jgi:hypothetical protein